MPHILCSISQLETLCGNIATPLWSCSSSVAFFNYKTTLNDEIVARSKKKEIMDSKCLQVPLQLKL
jgi:hypothetical protein